MAFLENEKTQDAVVRNFESIGEACRNIERFHADFAAEYNVDLEIVWKTLHNDLPGLAERVGVLLENIEPTWRTHAPQLCRCARIFRSWLSR